MSADKKRAFIYRDTPGIDYSVQFLVVEEEDHTWSLPEVEATGKPQLFADGHDFYGRYLGHAPEFFSSDPYFWVSYKSLRSIVEFKKEGIREATDTLPGLLCDPKADASPLTFTDEQWTVMLAKPDAMERNLTPIVEKAVVDAGLNIETITDREQLTEADVERIWTPSSKWDPPQEPTEWWSETVNYMTEGPVRAYLLSGEHATTRADAIRKTIRSVYDADPHNAESEKPISQRVRSLIHVSDRAEELTRNASLFWENSEIHDVMKARFERLKKNAE